MSNQELLEAIAPYIPYGVTCSMQGEIDDNGKPIIATVAGICKERDDRIWIDAGTSERSYSNLIEDVTFRLRPLSDLTKPCLEGGKVPIVELAKIEALLEPIAFDTMEDLKGQLRGVCANDRFNNQWLMFDFKEGFSMWHKPHDSPDHTLTLLDHQLQLFQWIYKYHFDIHGLIEKGYAIDINTLSNDSNT